MLSPLRLAARRTASRSTRTLLASSAKPLTQAFTTTHSIQPIRSFSSSPLSRSEATSASSSGGGQYENLLVTSPAAGVSLITLNRPKALNALSSPLFHELNAVLSTLSMDDSIGCVVLTGSDKAFAAGADIKEMKDKEFADVYKNDFLAHWTQMTKFRKPIIAAVSGYALGGGCELAMMCDIILASPNATFGQPEINLGVIPGAGGTQRLVHAIGKSRAMEIVLTGRNFSATEAASWGLVSRLVEGSNNQAVVDEAVKVASKIASKGRVAVQAGKEAVNASQELGLEDGLRFERRLFHQLFATKDQKIGMRAFAEKKKAEFVHE
ncbi:enoyl-CoA hydratase [Microbotryum lychnidis-dioicae p1A1 Lamole]|uniref:Probable enoyl-CoA hydratase, mitochondrial n=1 Tax=Microbotryum lychnidis-dioicae (strain p1A1 Lamole / MvSl-1064) TaxID=683840 RepID=U5HIX2_USTV1|nr:enoyl-CoA hydratase [Microbotryum lychnidis-dioicae p1A1 Lamole]|eukprot:KDE02475.1 enoyl-CoA hydratase [Microbotryum lychnidis-dioicae p1A1 Lamole]